LCRVKGHGNRGGMSNTRALALLPAVALLAGCATTVVKTPGDPYEGFNRKMWGFDQTLDRVAFKPVAKGYVAVVPRFLRRGLSNMLDNVSEPFSAINSVLQGKPVRALNSVGRFVINTTVGIGGFRDVASKVGYPQTPEDLGQTFAVWGAKKSSYLVLPFYGPTTIRDGIGTAAAHFADPYRIVIRDQLSFWPSAGITVFELVDARANLIDSGADSLLESSADSYAVARSAYLQRRDAQIADRDDQGAVEADDAGLDAALNELGPADGANDAAPATNEAAPPSPGLSPDQPSPAQTSPAPPGG
jgi:phospholipid-binding lipoprotein MlaA